MTAPEKSDQTPKTTADDSASTPSTAPVLKIKITDSTEVVEDEADATTESKTDSAVDDIMKSDGDAALEAQDAASEAAVTKLSVWGRFKSAWKAWWSNPRRRYTSIGFIVVLLAVIFGLPFTRANVLGLAVKAPVIIRVVDSKTGAPVSGATVLLAGQKAETDASGKATLRVNGGSKTLAVSKKYYSGYTHQELVVIGSDNTFKATLGALGQQVKVKVVDKVSGKPLAGASVSAQGASAKTDASGLATVVIPSGADTQTASVNVSGYHTLKVTITAGGDLAKNTFTVVPAGKLYFLSNLSGRIDVVKTNLDGTDRQVVLEGTGSEDRSSTSLLASRDWKYLALLAKRSGDKASVYMIDTTNGDKLTTVDQGDANFSLVGWSGSRFVYQVTRSTVQNWQSNQQALKSLDATTGQTLLLDQTQASGTNDADYVRQQLGSSYIMGDQVVYAKNWTASYSNVLGSKQAELDSIGADGSGHKVVKTFSLDAGTQTGQVWVSTRLYEPNGLYVYFQGGAQDTFYDYEDGKITSDTTMTQDKFYGTPYATYLLSPSGSSTFWSDQRDGKNTLFTGDQDGGKSKTIASLSGYNTYGWYTDNYLLVSKNSSELYIMPKDGGTPLKITDYYKPSINYQGYGGGYGGL